MIGRDHDRVLPGQAKTLTEIVQRGVFPLTQGTPNLGEIAAKARALLFAMTPGFSYLAAGIVSCAKSLAEELIKQGFDVVTGGTDNHMVVLDLTSRGITGAAAQNALERCGILVNKNMVPHDRKKPTVASGIRLGTNTLALRGMDERSMTICAELMDVVLAPGHVHGDSAFVLPQQVEEWVSSQVAALCRRYPLQGYPVNPSQRFRPGPHSALKSNLIVKDDFPPCSRSQ